MAKGIKFLGDGEWQARKHGLQGRRQWRELHPAMDTATSDIRAVGFDPSRKGDGPVLPDLPDQIPQGEDIGTATADGACDTRRCRSARIARGGTAIIPIRKSGRPWTEDCPAARARNETLRATRHHGRALRKRWPGYHARSRAEARMRGLMSFGERIAAVGPCSPDRWRSNGSPPIAKPPKSTAASHARTASTHSAPPRSSARPEPEGKGEVTYQPDFCNNAPADVGAGRIPAVCHRQPCRGPEWAVLRDRAAEIPADKVPVPGAADTTTNVVAYPDILARRLQRVVDVLGPDRAIAGADCGFGTFAGLGMGGIEAMEIVHQAPERVERLALLDTNPRAELPEAQTRRAPRIARARAGGLAAVMRDEMTPTCLADPTNRAVLDLCLDMALALGPEAFRNRSLALRGRADRQAALAADAGPAPVPPGAHERLFPHDRHALMHALMPQSDLVAIAGAGRLPLPERPAPTAAAPARRRDVPAPGGLLST